MALLKTSLFLNRDITLFLQPHILLIEHNDSGAKLLCVLLLNDLRQSEDSDH